MNNQFFHRVTTALIIVVLTLNGAFAQDSNLLTPDLVDVQYGTHKRNVLDVWFADTTRLTPLAIYIHGGGFVSGSKERINPKELEELLDAGIAVASINYRFLSNAPLPAAHEDALRALQFIRSKAEAWKIDKTKIAAFGNSAGAQLSMWLAFSDEMGQSDAVDPVERESSRLYCVATKGGQTTMDMELWYEWIPEFSGYQTSQKRFFGKKRPKKRKQVIENISAISIISSDDPPIFMKYGMSPDEPVPSGRKAQGWKIHHVIFGIKLKEKMDALGVEADLKYPSASNIYRDRIAFLKAKLL